MIPPSSRPTEDVADVQGAPGDGMSGTENPPPIPFQQRRALREIEVYISDRPILEAILEHGEQEQMAAGIVLSPEVLIPQPHAIVFPSADIAATASAAAVDDLHRNFNRFMVEQVHAPQQRAVLNRRLDKYFAPTVDRSFINMLPVLTRWPTGASLAAHDGAAADD